MNEESKRNGLSIQKIDAKTYDVKMKGRLERIEAAAEKIVKTIGDKLEVEGGD